MSQLPMAATDEVPLIALFRHTLMLPLPCQAFSLQAQASPSLLNSPSADPSCQGIHKQEECQHGVPVSRQNILSVLFSSHHLSYPGQVPASHLYTCTNTISWDISIAQFQYWNYNSVLNSKIRFNNYEILLIINLILAGTMYSLPHGCIPLSCSWLSHLQSHVNSTTTNHLSVIQITWNLKKN